MKLHWKKSHFFIKVNKFINWNIFHIWNWIYKILIIFFSFTKKNFSFFNKWFFSLRHYGIIRSISINHIIINWINEYESHRPPWCPKSGCPQWKIPWVLNSSMSKKSRETRPRGSPKIGVPVVMKPLHVCQPRPCASKFLDFYKFNYYLGIH
mgnify:CR=1 FL=1